MKFSNVQKRKINGGKYYWGLQEWVNRLYVKYPKCIICGSKDNLEAHHLIRVKPYNDLYTNIDNGVIVCKKCHREYHNKYDEDINPVTFLEYALWKNKKND